ncbi:hypothetical protein RHGRI_001706 [Rhododendron griersonianum]|uniref:Uncharacterized protein n=1 Tax=Rhododendron griersonianum TaxID=479676 RepID=A0AAV6LMD2_9ERIC|nr:hypothetical protein RHGRI_036045 [Rhododendron griersonianum]KAG5551870.1 hypothetical protein RHGRI_010094 [Rhododendron griersonianum]KAG5565880.1 hypothetical protein RHGRI_001706 [Rhododendron griersonianum]
MFCFGSLLLSIMLPISFHLLYHYVIQVVQLGTWKISLTFGMSSLLGCFQC